MRGRIIEPRGLGRGFPQSVPRTPVASYSTNFGVDESPVYENGVWRSGRAHGGDWTDITVASARAYGSQVGGAGGGPPYDDSLACLSGFAANHSGSVTIAINAGGDPGSFHEAEILLRWDIQLHVARGYELLYAYDGAYVSIVAWNGPQNDFTPLVDGTPTGALANGDVLLGTVVGNVISFYRNAVLVVQYTDTRFNGNAQWAGGNPGMGMWRRAGTGLPPRLQYTHFEAFSL